MRGILKRFWPIWTLAVWTLFQALCVFHFWSDRLVKLPPFWDNLSYQLIAIQLAKMDGVFTSYLGSAQPWGWIWLLGASYRLSHFSVLAPFCLAGIFSFLFCLGVYFLLRLLNLPKLFSVIYSVAVSSTPIYLYYNFLNTRNDYPMAAILAFAFVMFLWSCQKKTKWGFFISGVLTGFAVLVKLSAPGYLVGALLIYILGFGQTGGAFRKRFQNLGFYIAGGFICAGWYVVPELASVIKYYAFWGEMKSWQDVQYNLATLFDRVFFYPKILVSFHFGIYLSLFVLAAILIGFFVHQIQKSKIAKEISAPPRLEILIVAALWVWPMFFLTVRGAFSQLGDIPYHPFLFATLAIPIYWSGLRLHKLKLPAYVLFAILLIFTTFYSAKTLQPEGPRDAGDFEIFQQHLFEFKKLHGIVEDPSIALFSHPLYNPDAAAWKWGLNGETRLPLHHSAFFMKLVPSEDPELIYQNLRGLTALVLTSRQDLIEFGGETFHTFNRLRVQLNDLMKTRGDYQLCESQALQSRTITLDYWCRK